MDTNLFPSDWIYDNIFHLSEDQYDEYRDLIREDVKRKFRLGQIESEGNDPVETGNSYGTPHDLASLYGQGRVDSDPANIPNGYDEDKELGRPQEKSSNRNTQDDNFGKDRLGVDGMKKDYNQKGSSSLALENLRSIKHMDMLKTIPYGKKQLVFEGKESEGSLLDESNIKEQ
jgi:hypothetical protein